MDVTKIRKAQKFNIKYFSIWQFRSLREPCHRENRLQVRIKLSLSGYQSQKARFRDVSSQVLCTELKLNPWFTSREAPMSLQSKFRRWEWTRYNFS